MPKADNITGGTLGSVDVYENKIDYIKFEKLGITFNVIYK